MHVCNPYSVQQGNLSCPVKTQDSGLDPKFKQTSSETRGRRVWMEVSGRGSINYIGIPTRRCQLVPLSNPEPEGRKERLVRHKQGRSRFQPVSAKAHWSCYHSSPCSCYLAMAFFDSGQRRNSCTNSQDFRGLNTSCEYAKRAPGREHENMTSGLTENLLARSDDTTQCHWQRNSREVSAQVCR